MCRQSAQLILENPGILQQKHVFYHWPSATSHVEMMLLCLKIGYPKIWWFIIILPIQTAIWWYRPSLPFGNDLHSLLFYWRVTTRNSIGGLSITLVDEP
jgi:hypothetical protein